jgi:hypothetical protein
MECIGNRYTILLKRPLEDGVEVYFYITDREVLRSEKVILTADSLPPPSPMQGATES